MVSHVCFEEILLKSAKEIFETMIFMDIQKSSEPEQGVQGDILLGSITFSGDLEGCFGICLGEPCAKAITLNMLGMETGEEISKEDINDAIGEVANMILGSIKAGLQNDLKNMNISIPTVMRGQKLENNLGQRAKKISTMVNIGNKYSAELSLLYREKKNNFR